MKLITFESMMRPTELPPPSLPGLTPECIAVSIEEAGQLRMLALAWTNPLGCVGSGASALAQLRPCLIWMLAGWSPTSSYLPALLDLEMRALVRVETPHTEPMPWHLTEQGEAVAIILRTWERDQRLARALCSGLNPTAHISN